MPHLFRRLRSWAPPNAEVLVPALPMIAPPQFVSGADPLNIVLTLVLLVLCLSVHEAAHAWVAWRCGDSTGKDLGRITLNPLPHIDPFMTILLPGFLMWQTGFIFGGAKPVPVSFHRLRHPWRDMSLVALAGPLSNFLLAILFMIAWRFFVHTGLYNGAGSTEGARRTDLLPQVLLQGVSFNLVLAVFNLIPVPPLDGSRVMTNLLPASMRDSYLAFERFGLLIVFGLAVFYRPFNEFLGGTVEALLHALDSMVTLGGRW